MMQLQYPAAWLGSHAITGLALLWVAYVVSRYRGFVREEYMRPFSLCFGAVGLHHLGLAVLPLLPDGGAPVWHLVQAMIDGIMLAIALLVTGFLANDVARTDSGPR